MSKPAIGQKRCAFKGCANTFTAIGRRAYCDEHRPGPNGRRPASSATMRGVPGLPTATGAYAEVKALALRLIDAGRALGLAEVPKLLQEAESDALRRALSMRKALIKSRHEVQKLKARLEAEAIGKGEKLGVEDLDPVDGKE